MTKREIIHARPTMLCESCEEETHERICSIETEFDYIYCQHHGCLSQYTVADNCVIGWQHCGPITYDMAMAYISQERARHQGYSDDRFCLAI